MTQLTLKQSENSSPELVSQGNPLPVMVTEQKQGTKPATYRAAFSFAAVSGDALVIFGQDGKVIKVTEIAIAKPSASETVLVVLRKTATSGGTSTVQTNVPLDSNDVLTSTTVRAYTAAGTAGTARGTIARCVVASADVLILTFGDKGKFPTLRSANECLAVNVDATATLPGWIEWTEE